MPDLTLILAALAAVISLVLLRLAIPHARRQPVARWLIWLLALGAMGSALHLLPRSPLMVALGVYADSALLVLFGGLTLVYLERPGRVIWLVVGALWLVALVIVDQSNPAAVVGTYGWLGEAYARGNPAALVALSGWLVAGISLAGEAFYAFYTAHLPEVANRALYWSLVTLPVLLGVLLSASGTPVLLAGGLLLGILGEIGAFHGVTGDRLFEVRRGLRWGMGLLAESMLTALAFFGALLLAESTRREFGPDWALWSGLAVVAGLTFAVARRLIGAGVRGVLDPSGPVEPGPGLRQYSQRIAAVIEPDQVVNLAMQTMTSVLRVRPGGVLLATANGNGHVALEPMITGDTGRLPPGRGDIAPDSPIYRTLIERQGLLLQFDLEYGRDYTGAGPEEREFFRQLRMSAYAPIVVDGATIGLLAAGPRLNDDLYSPADLEMLATIASQTGIALRNARLVSDLRRLNRELASANDVFTRLDRVKTDFITIASHELRTPLAQIRGYADIIHTLQEQGLLDPAQLDTMTENLSKASERMEVLISDMLDVSKLDVDAMDLHFTETSLESVIRMAIEPLTDAIRTRKIGLAARGLRHLPVIEADMQRLVQAFRNVIVNAVKYTPDGGLIEIDAALQAPPGLPAQVHITVRDTGIGIDPAHHELIFEKFYRVADPSLHSTGATKFMGAGPGLGLTIARGMIEGHGGRVWVESAGHDPERCPGSTFHVMLPVKPPSDARSVQPFDETRRALSFEERSDLDARIAQARQQ